MAMTGFLTAFTALTALTAAQDTFDFYARGPYRAEVPRPEALLGYAPGDRHTQYAAQQAALDALIAASPERGRLEAIGHTEEDRPMRILLISAPANLARLDDIRADLARLADPRRTSAAEAAAIVARTPAVVFLSYSVHGNEPAGFEAVMWVAYQLLASDEPATRTMLDSVLVILNPSANPDGHERFAAWYNSLSMRTDEPYAYETREPWSVWGRFSHYRFDMNRDLIAQSQAPVRAMLGAMRRWNPQVVVDHHSTTDPFFFPPFAEPVNPHIPAGQIRWIEVFGRGNAAAFDRYGWQYYTRDIFDGFYPGYFDVAPALAGATGMTYESDGGPELRIRREDGTVITFRDGIAHHHVASLATIATAAEHRTARLTDFHDFHRSALRDAAAGGMRRIVVLPGNDPTNASRLAALLLGHGVEVTRLTTPYAAAARDYLAPDGRPARRTFPAGALVVDLAQPEGRMARALLEPDAPFPPAFVERELEKFRRNLRRGDAPGEGHDFYDVTAWSLPYTFGLEAFWTDDQAALAGDALALTDPDRPFSLAPPGGVSARARSAYVFHNDRQAAAALALALLREGFTLSVSTEPLRADGESHPAGTFVLRTQRNRAGLHERLTTLADSLRVPVTAVMSAFPDSGAVGVGSETVEHVKPPKVLVAAGDGIGQTSYGALWYFLERELGQPFVPIELSRLGGMYTMGDYNVLIIPEGGGVRGALGAAGLERLKAWVRDGGVLITFGHASFLSAEGVELSTVTGVGEEEEDEGEKKDSLPRGPELVPPLPSPSADSNAVAPVPGAIFRATLDRSHWLTLGYERRTLPVMFSGSTMLRPSQEGANPVVFVGDDLHLSGFVWPGNTERLLEGTIWSAVERHGRGHVVLFAEDPLFRAFWRGTARLVTNAMLFGTGR